MTITPLSAQPRSQLFHLPNKKGEMGNSSSGQIPGKCEEGRDSTSLDGNEVLLAASRRLVVHLVEKIVRNISSVHPDRHRVRNGAHVSVETEEFWSEWDLPSRMDVRDRPGAGQERRAMLAVSKRGGSLRRREPGSEWAGHRGMRDPCGWSGGTCREPAFQRGWCAAQRSGQGGERDHRGWPGAGCRAQGVQREGMDLRVLILTALSRACDGADSEMVEAPLCLASFLHSRGRRVQLGEPGHVRGACIGRRVHGACACEPFVDADPKISIPQIFSSDHAAHLFL
jgi:hypothetical protein